MVVKENSVTNHSAGVLQALNAVSMRALLLDRSDHAFNHSVLLKAVRSYELLAQSVAPDQSSVMAAGEHPVHCRTAARKARARPPQCSEPGDEGSIPSGPTNTHLSTRFVSPAFQAAQSWVRLLLDAPFMSIKGFIVGLLILRMILQTGREPVLFCSIFPDTSKK